MLTGPNALCVEYWPTVPCPDFCFSPDISLTGPTSQAINGDTKRLGSKPCAEAIVLSISVKAE